ncbi:hypothetical protein V5799_012064, partial [Amblyomma americanum]
PEENRGKVSGDGFVCRELNTGLRQNTRWKPNSVVSCLGRKTRVKLSSLR